VPEVVQTSSLDCGPAALKALLDGYGRNVSYGRLREACQTGLDGTSIDTIELVANQLGLEAEQIMLPADHLLLREAQAFPAIVVVTLAQGITHFVVVWRRFGNWLQLMDPSVGRRWVRAKTFLKDVYQHKIQVGAQDWISFASSEDFQRVFRIRQKAVGVALERTSGADWRPSATQDAAVRLTQSLVNKGGVSKGHAAQKIAAGFCAEPDLIPPDYWSVTEAGADDDGNEQVFMRGAVLVRVKSRRRVAENVSEELAAALNEKPIRPGRELWRALLKSGGLIWPILLTALLAAAMGAFLEALLFRGLLDVNGTLALAGQRMGAAGAVLVFCCALLLLELPSFATGARLGRILENRLRMAFLEKLPKLSDRYFQSRPVSDMAERSHILHRLRHLPDQWRQLILATSQLIVTAAGVVWLDPSAWPFMLASLGAALIPFFSSHWLLAERDLRVRTHSGGLMRFYLDAMLGLMPIRTHGAAENVRPQHGILLGEWTAASFRLQRTIVLTEGLQLFAMFGLVAALLLIHPFSGAQVGRVLLMAYWALNMPALGQQIATLARQYPNYRSIALRLLEPLGAAEEETATALGGLTQPPFIECRNVHVVASGNTILRDVSVALEAGSHVAIVGPSGAGKSTLVGLLLGWLKASSGDVLINGAPLQVEHLRKATAWVDPAVQLWNCSLQANLLYGGDGQGEFSEAIDAAALRHVLENLPHGLQTLLGENGGLVSGGEGQRVRFGRALQRRDAKLVILDEPFRGLDREKRRELLRRAREYWRSATLLCVTHDIAETQGFERVLVIEGGTIIENDSPRELASNRESRYSQLLASEEKARVKFWESSEWRRVRLHSGQVVEKRPKPLSVEARESEVA
jgi:ATP-binding cassette subfamily B protein